MQLALPHPFHRPSRMEMMRRRGAHMIRSERGRWMAAGAAAGAAMTAAAKAFDKRRRHMVRDRAVSKVRHGSADANRKARYLGGVAHGMVHRMRPGGNHRDYDDTTLARKVETEIFRPADAPKGRVDVNAHDGVVELRGTVDRPEQITQLVAATQRVDGVREVRNLLHTPVSAR